MQALGIRTRRLARRHFSAGFTLIELMVVVVLISVLAVIAAPAMSDARNDRLAFDYARRIQQMVHRARARAAGRGGAHLVVAGPSGTRGKVFLFEALDNIAPSAGGPNPSTSCKGVVPPLAAGQWATVPAFTPALAVNNSARLIEGLDLNDTAGVNVDANIVSSLRFGVATDALIDLPPAVAFAYCVTGTGTTYAAAGGDITAAINNMLTAAPFTGVADILVTRGGGIGITRHVMIAGAAAPRLFSQ